MAALVAAVLTEEFPWQYWLLAEYIMVMGVLSLACVWRLAETSRKDIA
jgi:hypothetical protein